MNKISYTIKNYLSNVEVFKTIEDEDGELIESGRVAAVICTGDNPAWTLGDEEWDEEDAMTSGYELGSYLESLADVNMEKWLEENGHGML